MKKFLLFILLNILYIGMFSGCSMRETCGVSTPCGSCYNSCNRCSGYGYRTIW